MSIASIVLSSFVLLLIPLFVSPSSQQSDVTPVMKLEIRHFFTRTTFRLHSKITHRFTLISLDFWRFKFIMKLGWSGLAILSILSPWCLLWFKTLTHKRQLGVKNTRERKLVSSRQLLLLDASTSVFWRWHNQICAQRLHFDGPIGSRLVPKWKVYIRDCFNFDMNGFLSYHFPGRIADLYWTILWCSGARILRSKNMNYQLYRVASFGPSVHKWRPVLDEKKVGFKKGGF